jgi:DNA-directed RNA polymerase subunit K
MMIWPKERLTRFEVARLVGARSLQIALGAPVLVKTDKDNPKEIAKEEFRERIIPMTVKRKTPSGEEIVIEIKEAIKNWMDTHAGEI